jgi:hypothetical protein
MTPRAPAKRKQNNFRLATETCIALVLLSEQERISQAQIIERSVEEYFKSHYRLPDPKPQ